MKIAVPVTDNALNSMLSLRFARSRYFAIINKEKNDVAMVANPYVNNTECVGRNIIDMLCNEHNVTTLVAFELGLHVQQAAGKRKMQLVLLNEKDKSLDELCSLMGFKNSLLSVE